MNTLQGQFQNANYLQPLPLARCGHIAVVVDKLNVRLIGCERLAAVIVYLLLIVPDDFNVGFWHRTGGHSRRHQCPKGSPVRSLRVTGRQRAMARVRTISCRACRSRFPRRLWCCLWHSLHLCRPRLPNQHKTSAPLQRPMAIKHRHVAMASTGRISRCTEPSPPRSILSHRPG